MIVVLLRGYVSEEQPYNNGFVHARVKAYIESGIDTKVFVLNPNTVQSSYVIDGVEVFCGDKEAFINMFSSNDIKVCVHFLDSVIIDVLNNAQHIKKIIIFVHGFEALRWYQRIFPGTFTNKACFESFINYVISNSREIPIIRRFLESNSFRCQFVTVSNWMKEQAEKAWNCRGKLKWHIIPNYIDSKLFKYTKKTDEDSKKLLSIRPFGSGKYANDITRKLITSLSDYKGFSHLDITWFGDGVLFENITKKLPNANNIHLERRMLRQNDIPSFHQANGLFICPTRQDAQGVSMCEAMSSGLVPITLYNTAIPEFLPDNDKLKCQNTQDMKELIIELLENPKLFLELSVKCSNFIQEKCSYGNTILKEIELFSKY